MAEITQTVLKNFNRAIQMPGQTDEEIRLSLEELGELLKTADVEMVGTLVQKRDRVTRAFIWAVARLTIADAAIADASLIVADDEPAAQIKTIEEATGICDHLHHSRNICQTRLNQESCSQ